jgi:hypothetical protein
MSQTTENKTETRFDYYGLLPHPTVRQVLLLSGELGWMLPHWLCTESLWWPRVAVFNRAMQELLGVEVTTLRCVYAERKLTEQGDRVFWMENPDPGWSPPAGARWIGREELDGLSLAQPAHRVLLEDWFADSPSPLRPAWEQPDGFAEMAGWIREQLDCLGITPIGGIEQQKIWSLSTILRVETSAGTLYFKAVPELFRAEARLTRFLSELYPDRTPALIACEETRGWMLLRDMGGKTLRQVADDADIAQCMHTAAAQRIVTRQARLDFHAGEILLAHGETRQILFVQ